MSDETNGQGSSTPIMGSLRRMNRRSLAAVVCIGALVLSACGESSQDDGPVGEVGAAATGAPFDPDAPLDAEQADQVVLTEADLGSEFDEQSSDQEDNSVLSCLAVIDDLDEFGPSAATHAERSFTATYDAGQGRLYSGVDSYDSEAQAADTFAALKEHAEGCGVLTDQQAGLRWRIETRVEEVSTTDADERIDIHGEGSVTLKKDKDPYLVDYAVGRVGNSIVMVALIHVNQKDPGPTVDEGFTTSLGRLLDLRQASS